MQAVMDFLQDRVNGKTLYTAPLRYTLEDKLEGEYADQISFCGLKYSGSGFQLDMFVVSNEKIYAPSSGGERGELRKDFSAVSLFRFELARRKSTGELTGLFRFIASSLPEPPAEAVVSGIHRVRLEDGVLGFREEQVLYRDQAADGGYRPVAFFADHKLYLEQGKLHYDYNGTSFDATAGTGELRASKDTFPPFHAVER